MPSSPRPALFISVDTEQDWLIACPYGCNGDGRPDEDWEQVADDIALLHDDGPGGPIVGFRVNDLSTTAPELPAIEPLWGGTHFDAPVLGLSDAPAGHVIVAAHECYAGRGTLNRHLVTMATQARGPRQAERAWRACLETGDLTAHLGLGCVLLDLDRPGEAYPHLRHYTELAPRSAWAWRFRGSAAEAIGEAREARRCYRRAITIAGESGDEDQITDADDLLTALDAQPARRRRRARGDRIELWGDELPQPGRQRIEIAGEELAAVLSSSSDQGDESSDAVIAVRLDHCVVLACATGHGGGAASHLALRVLVDEMTGGGDPSRLLPEENDDLWRRVGAALSLPAGLHDGAGTEASLTLAVVCCDAVLWSAIGDPLLVFADADGTVTYPDRGGRLRLDWQLEADELLERVRRGVLPLPGPGSLLLHSRLRRHELDLDVLCDPVVPVEYAIGAQARSGEPAAAAVLMRL